MRRLIQLLTVLALWSCAHSAQAAPPSVPAADAPELAALGPHGVGTSTIRVRSGAPDTRTLRVVLWYPASVQAGSPVSVYRHRLQPPPPLTPLDVTTEGMAVPDAAPVKGRHPLVIVSHGYRGWPESMSYITENLASKGYVVAGIDHGDLPFTDSASFAASFGLTASTRARDQQAVLAHLAGLASAPRDGLGGAIDSSRVALIGYSMGGFGALATAGAGYDPQSPAYRSLPAGALADQAEGRRKPDARVRAVIAIAPWGAQPPHRAWSPGSLKQLRAPLLVIAGDQDDISGYADGIRPIFDQATGSDRHLLLYRNARHNVGGNPVPAEAAGSFQYREMFEEPVWRQDRITAINQHFITAFLNRHLKNDAAAAAFLVPATDSAAGWPGFQKRWALGFELHRKPAE
ncbi:MAG TPA: dienelactone hydrolase family protein [Allosphingosinicella sp.]